MAVGIEQNFADLPLSTLIALVTVVTIAGAIAIRVISNTFHGNRPPVDEGIPFVGGLIKFSKVSRQVKFVCVTVARHRSSVISFQEWTANVTSLACLAIYSTDDE